MEIAVAWMRTTPLNEAIHNVSAFPGFYRFERDWLDFNSAADSLTASRRIPQIDLAGICGPRGQSLACVGAGTSSFRLAVENGATHIVAGGDVGFLAAGAKEAVRQAREILNSVPSTSSIDEKT